VNTIVLTAHGSADPRSAANARALGRRLASMRADLHVRVAFLEKNTPRLSDVLTELPDDSQTAVSPLLLADAYHARVDIPAQIARAGALGVRQAGVLGEDHRLVSVLRQRLEELGCCSPDAELGVLVAAVGSSDPVANTRTAGVADALAVGTRWVAAMPAFVTGPRPSLPEVAARLRHRGARRLVIVPWFLASGLLTDRVAAYAHDAGVLMAAPLGAHPNVAATVLSRYDQALAERVAA
jgi:sirohydrochlorin ferrochelatase